MGPEETAVAEMKLRRDAWDGLRRKMGEEMSDINILQRFRNRFDREFRYDDQGVPRVWKPEDDIDEAYRKAREVTFRMFPIFQKIGINVAAINELLGDEDAVSEQSLVLLGEAKTDDLFSRIQRDLDVSFTEAKRSVIFSSAQIPPWVFLLLVILGWNEAVAVLSNPLYFAISLAGLLGFYVLSATGLWGPAKNMVVQRSRQFSRNISEAVDGTGLSAGSVLEKARSVTNAALDAGSNLVDSHRAAAEDIQMETVTPTDSPSPSKIAQNVPAPYAAELRQRNVSTPGAFREVDRERRNVYETPVKYR